MSEFQYYEFRAIDRQLTSEEMSALRKISSRAHITPVSFVNVYNWGDFKGDPVKLMKRYFDAHVYVANWMTAIYMVRIPIDVLSRKTAKEMAVRDILDFDTTQNHWVITWCLTESENYDRFAVEAGEGWMERLVPVRDELLRGDIRSLYIGWLSAVSGKIVGDDEIEPSIPYGLGDLTAAQRALAEFLEVDDDLLEGARTGNPGQQDNGPSEQEMIEWLEELPHEEVVVLLKQLLEGHSSRAERNLKNSFSAWVRSKPENLPVIPRRTVGELLKNADAAKNIRLEQEKKKQAKIEAKRAKEYNAYLASLAENFPKVWNDIQKKVDKGSGLLYDEACRDLVDLSKAYTVHRNQILFQQDLKVFMDNNIRRRALVKRLVKAGLWNKT